MLFFLNNKSSFVSFKKHFSVGDQAVGLAVNMITTVQYKIGKSVFEKMYNLPYDYCLNFP
jgi:hypothetical protein